MCQPSISFLSDKLIEMWMVNAAHAVYSYVYIEWQVNPEMIKFHIFHILFD